LLTPPLKVGNWMLEIKSWIQLFCQLPIIDPPVSNL
jgi:hypothetical protein